MTLSQRAVLAARDPALDAIFHSAGDNRRLRLADNAAYEEAWAAETALVARYPGLHDTLRDGRCHEAIMWFTHHVPSAVQAELKEAGLTLPRLPAPAPAGGGDAATARAAFGPRSRAGLLRAAGAPRAAVDAAYDAYASAVTCSACHASGASVLNDESTSFPDELEYNATAYSAFPFWDNTGAGCEVRAPPPAPKSISPSGTSRPHVLTVSASSLARGVVRVTPSRRHATTHILMRASASRGN